MKRDAGTDSASPIDLHGFRFAQRYVVSAVAGIDPFFGFDKENTQALATPIASRSVAIDGGGNFYIIDSLQMSAIGSERLLRAGSSLPSEEPAKAELKATVSSQPLL